MSERTVGTSVRRLSDIGEKAMIREFIKPLFNEADDPGGVGDDCAMVAFGSDVALLSTDRVPSDLTAVRLGILDAHGLGDYVARLNLSDVAACGGRAVGLLLNLGLPNDIEYSYVQAICRGFGKCAARHGAAVLGGDITAASELSISATAIGKAKRGQVLTRRDARPGDSIFASRPLGMTPTAFRVFLGGMASEFRDDELELLRKQFTDMQPMLPLGWRLSDDPARGACMDNTDGVGQSLTELADSSGVAFIVEKSVVQIPPVVARLGVCLGCDPLEFMFDGGADFSLVGTLRGKWSSDEASSHFGHPLQIIGSVEEGQGVWLRDQDRRSLQYQGWNYFCR